MVSLTSPLPLVRANTAVMAITLNTLEYARTLQEYGFSEEQAEGQARALAGIMIESLATKDDFRELGGRLVTMREWIEYRLAEMQAQMDGRFAEMQAQMDGRFLAMREHIDGRFAAAQERADGRLASGLADLERRLTVRLGGMMLAGIGAVSALVRIL